MKHLLYLFFIINILSSCFIYKKNYNFVSGKLPDSDSDDCIKLYLKIKKEWAVHNSVLCYYYRKGLLEEIVSKEKCFIGLDTSDIILLFGKPSGKAPNAIEYNLSKNCKSGDDYLAEYLLRFYTDFSKKSNIISSVTFEKVYIYMCDGL